MKIDRFDCTMPCSSHENMGGGICMWDTKDASPNVDGCGLCDTETLRSTAEYVHRMGALDFVTFHAWHRTGELQNKLKQSEIAHLQLLPTACLQRACASHQLVV